jgi:hypothetical protein
VVATKVRGGVKWSQEVVFWWPKPAQGQMVRPPVPLYRLGGDLNGWEACGH